MKHLLTLVVLTALAAAGSFAQTQWTLDKAHTAVKFSVTHLIISEVEGNFKSFDGSLKTGKDDFSDAAVEFTVDVASINTDNEKRDNHLRSDDFFNAEKFPKMTFKSVAWKKTADGKYALEGDLTIRDITKRVVFDVTSNGTIKDPWGNTKAGFKAVGSVNRFDYNLKWNSLTEAGGAVVGKEVTITLNLEFAKKAA